jgi:outer membrane biosynthesis protein TonB
MLGPWRAISRSWYSRNRRGTAGSGDTVRKLITVALTSTAVVALACGKSKAPASTAMSDDLKRDLQLASATQDLHINPDEVTPSSKPAAALTPKKAPSGPKVVRTSHPTVKASPKPVEVAELPAEVPEAQVMASAPATESAAAEPSTDAAPPLARPAALPAPSAPAGQSTAAGTGTYPGNGNGGVGGVLGGIFGVVIRGGGVGDDDHCDPRPQRGGGRTDRGGIYGRPGGAIPRMPTGMGGARFPVTPMGRPR